MNHTKRLLLALSLFSPVLEAKQPVDCRVIVEGMRECNPYSPRLMKAKEIKYQKSLQKLIVDKTLPVPSKPHVKVIPVEEMIERYIKVEPPKRFRGTQTEAIMFPKKKGEALRSKPLSQEENMTVVSQEANVTVPEAKTEKEREASLEYGRYKVKKGDTLGRIALIFGMKSSRELMKFNQLTKKDALKIGQELKIPMRQEMIDSIASASYKVKEGDSLISIAKKFNLDPKDLAHYNGIKNTGQIRVGKVLKLPLPYLLAEEKAKKKREAKKRARSRWNKKKKTYSSKFIRGFGKHKLRVTATAYSSHRGQTDSTPFLAAWNNRLRPGMKVIAVSRDLLYKYGMKNGTKVKISGLPGIYRVRDKMNKRYKRRIDIYMGTNRRKALRWGRRSVVIYW
ncbi:MAG: LysM peptidoglycan-binding domain-containing protein [Sulfurovum sp.]|nr:LysM peptidoglycan-binding domain-containing protein [Sulfurovum sp.]